MSGMSEQPSNQLPSIDWDATPHMGAVLALSVIASAVGVFGLAIGLTSSALVGFALTIAGAVILAAGVVGWIVYAVAMWWRQESRNQLLALSAAVVTGSEDAAPDDPRWRRF